MYSMLMSNEAVLVLEIDLSSEVKVSLQSVTSPPIIGISDLFMIEAGSQNGESRKDSPDKRTADTPTTHRAPGVMINGMQLAGDIWVEHSDPTRLVINNDAAHSATSTLCSDIAQVLGIEVCASILPLEEVSTAALEQRAFFISDEFGFLPIGEMDTNDADDSGDISATRRIAKAFAKLW